MRNRILILAFSVIGLNSCTTMYKSGQTPDDVYYSPGRTTVDYVDVDAERSGRYRNDDYYSTDRYLRMKAQGRNRWSAFDDDFFYWDNPTWNNPFYFNSFYSPWSSPWIGTSSIYSYNYWNSGFFNPFLPGYYSSPVVIVTKPSNPRAYTPRGGNLGTYNTTRNASDTKTTGRIYNISSSPRSSNSSGGNYYSSPSNRSSQYSNSGSSSTFRTFGSGSGGSSTNSAPRSSGSSGSSGNSGGSAPVRSFPRGGGN